MMSKQAPRFDAHPTISIVESNTLLTPREVQELRALNDIRSTYAEHFSPCFSPAFIKRCNAIERELKKSEEFFKEFHTPTSTAFPRGEIDDE